MHKTAGPIVLVAVVVLGAACGTESPANTGNAGSGGRGGASGSGGTGGAGGAPAPCPATPPQSGANCTTTLDCYYEDCAGAGRTIATCVIGVSAPRWSVSTSACTTVTCPNPSALTCAAGQICLVRAGGAFLAECVSNDCGTSAISCGCIQSCFGDCAVSGSAPGGVTVTCNTCPQGNCP